MTGETGMAGFITGLTGSDGITAANVWNAITPAAGFAAGLIIIKIGYRFVTGLMNNTVNLKSKKVAR